MDRFFDANNPLMRALARLVDLVILNVITLIGCIPVVTAGASLTAMHYVLVKYVREEETYTWRMYRHSFKENLKPGILLGLIYLAFGAVATIDLVYFSKMNTRTSTLLMIVITVISIFIVATGVYAFTWLSRFVNGVGTTIRNAFVLAIGYIPRTCGIIIVWGLWILFLVLVPGLRPLMILLFGFSLPDFLCTLIINSVFEKLETGEE